MRTFIFVILTSLSLSVFAQKHITITDTKTGEAVAISVPDGLVVTSGFEDEQGEYIATDTVYADYEYDDCAVDTVECDTAAMEPLISAEKAFSLAKEYKAQGRSFEMIHALYQSWLLGNMDKVDIYISESTEIQKALSFLMFFDDVPKGHDKEVLDFMNSMIPDNDTEMCVLAEILKYAIGGTDEFKALETFRTDTSKKYKHNPFYKYLNAIIEYDDSNNYKSVTQSFNEIKALADEEIELAYPELARKYANGSGTEKDKEKAREYFMKTVDAGILSKHDAQQFLYFLNDNTDIFVSDEHRVHLMRTISISLPYWLNIQKRLNNLKTMSINKDQ